MTSKTNKASYMVEKGKPFEIKEAPYPKPTDNQIVVKNHAFAINPVDWMLQAIGTSIFPWVKLPVILGCDLAGEVLEVGSKVNRYKPGDRIVALPLGVTNGAQDNTQGCFQQITLIREDMSAPIPEGMTYEEACVIPLGLSTAASALYQKDYLNLPLPKAEEVQSQNKTLLIWGGSTSVGSNAIQLAKASGYEVFTTCSPRNFDYVKKLGASQAWDYNSPTVIDDIIKALSEKDCAGAFSIGAGAIEKCVTILGNPKLKTVNKFVAMAGRPGQPEKIPEGFIGMASVITNMLAANLILKAKTMMNGVKTNFVFGSDLEGNEVGPGVWKDFLGAALANKTFIPSPEAFIVEKKGLEGIEEGFIVQKKGMSAKKVVVSL